jgi:hypothetical protein
MKRWVLILAVLAAGCLDGEGVPDARVYQDDFASDARAHPGFRDAGCPGGTTSGASGADCGGDGGNGVVADAAVPDAALPDATPCDEVTFSHQSDFPDMQSLWVTGTFTQPEEWATDPDNGALELEHVGGGLWEVTARVGDPPSDTGYHEYKFISDGEHYFHDPEFENVDDGFGGRNNVLYVCQD